MNRIEYDMMVATNTERTSYSFDVPINDVVNYTAGNFTRCQMDVKTTTDPALQITIRIYNNNPWLPRTYRTSDANSIIINGQTVAQLLHSGPQGIDMIMATSTAVRRTITVDFDNPAQLLQPIIHMNFNQIYIP